MSGRLLSLALVVGVLAIPAMLLYVHRIEDQQRVHSCKQTRLVIREIFEPFFPAAQGRTRQQQQQLDKFMRLTDPQRCENKEAVR